VQLCATIRNSQATSGNVNTCNSRHGNRDNNATDVVRAMHHTISPSIPKRTTESVHTACINNNLEELYVIATSTKVDISKVDVTKFDDKYFGKKVEKKKIKGEGEFFEAKKEVIY
ncbi:60S ribosomal protein L6-1-like protein, partial [Tanacetum coccineum]